MNQAASRRLALESDLRRAHQQATSCACTTSRSSTRRAGASPRTRRWCAGSTRARPGASPREFIQLAEETGLILQIGDWVLRRGLPLGHLHRRRSMTAATADRGQPLGAAVQRPAAAARSWRAALRETGLPPRLLELEITESTAMQQTDVALRTLQQPEAARRVDRDRRLRHRLLEPLLPAALPGGQAEDRPQLRRRAARRPRPGRDRLGDRRPRARAADPGGRRGRRDRGAARVPALAAAATSSRATSSASRSTPTAPRKTTSRPAASLRARQRLSGRVLCGDAGAACLALHDFVDRSHRHGSALSADTKAGRTWSSS